MVYKLLRNGEKLCNVFVAESFKDRFLGYMFRKKPHHEAILFKPCYSIHTFFMKFEIDVLFLDGDMNVIKKVEGLKKGKIIYEKDAKMVVETKFGGFSKIVVGDKLNIEFI
ncbi:hypothetical protein ABG79_02445 [Caloramator mitchellensis]|uniref:ACR n=1 Tax=Caloramator mitchellensis TaxID=908809 RepID=A0A0R3JQQ8_CALMK|nr:DUF192 domain-containing protein [Caloramator mitchellensis]KRQ85779.1 hypothetical protein ABG79_02445 [Caloramator mitchellensis]